jgi:hypothetical protein
VVVVAAAAAGVLVIVGGREGYDDKSRGLRGADK